MRCCDRRRRAGATSSIAFVTLRVFVIERTRRFRSCVEAKLGGFLCARLETLLELLDLFLQLRLDLFGDVAGLADRLVDSALGAKLLAELVLEPHDVLRRDVVEVPVDAGV